MYTAAIKVRFSVLQMLHFYSFCFGRICLSNCFATLLSKKYDCASCFPVGRSTHTVEFEVLAPVLRDLLLLDSGFVKIMRMQQVGDYRHFLFSLVRCA